MTRDITRDGNLHIDKGLTLRQCKKIECDQIELEDLYLGASWF
jgi:hypothetical protein